MLLNFAVKNYMSIKELGLLDLISEQSRKNGLVNISESSEYQSLHFLAVFGSNASGKTNLIRAFESAIWFIRYSNQMLPGEEIHYMYPFLFDEKMASKPCTFEFAYLAPDNIKYIYGFSATREKVTSEYLYAYYSSHPSCIFERENITDYKFPKTERKKLAPLISKNSDNKLLLATAAQWNYGRVKPAYQWFYTQVEVYTSLERDKIKKTIQETLDKGKTTIIDDLDQILHPLETEYLIQLFESINSNPKHSQLVFTTKDTNLLSLNLFRPEQIYFTDKDKSGNTEIYSLVDFNIKETDNIKNNYLLGRYGAIPRLVKQL